MKYLIYSLFTHSEPFISPTYTGIDNQPLTIIHYQQLNAVVSKKITTPLSKEVTLLLKYHQIIELLHEQYSVIPMRYGCLFESETQIQQWLETNYTVYRNLLAKIKDCVEIGIRIWPHETPPLESVLTEKRTGKDYLGARQQFYLAQDQLTAEQKQLVTTFYHHLSKFIKASKQEYHFTSRLTSLYFLVPNTHVQSFQDIFAMIENNTTLKLFLSGPWAPYNFVSTD